MQETSELSPADSEAVEGKHWCWLRGGWPGRLDSSPPGAGGSLTNDLLPAAIKSSNTLLEIFRSCSAYRILKNRECSSRILSPAALLEKEVFLEWKLQHAISYRTFY